MRLKLLSIRTARWVIVWTALLSAAMPGHAVQATLVADAHVNSALPAINSGAISNLNVGAGYTSLVQFDLGVLPSGTAPAQVSKAVLTLFCNRVNTPGIVAVQPVNAVWGEYSLTYATLPALGSSMQNIAVSQAGTYVAVDVTALVQRWIGTSGTNNGVALSSAAGDVQFDSKENDQTGHAPTLEITLVNSGPAGPQGVVGPAGAPGPQGVQGLAGAAGVAGPMGPAGATGPSGPQGVIGPAGPVGLRFQGAYSASQTYAAGDGVLYGGAGYVSLTGGNTGNAPDRSPSQWTQFAAGGAGPAGPTGPAGPQGPVGATGQVGPAGAAGAQGPVGVRYRGTWASTSSYAANDAASFNGSSYLAQSANYSQQPNLYPSVWAILAAGGQGPAGPAGPTGPGATVSVGSVTTGAAGSPASVTNTGTTSNAVLNFTIPQGQPGAGGANGTSGTDVSAASVYHSVSNQFLFYSVTSGNFSGGTDTAQVLTWVPNGCTASRLMVFSQQAQTITVTLRLGHPSMMSDTGLLCVVLPNSPCTASGNVAVAAGDFIDLSVHGATGTPSPVWTALTCN